jgi:hypothetical protein
VTTAFTIGNEHSYDQALAYQPGPAHKLGARLEDDPPYKGGCIWRTPEEAHEYIVTQGGRPWVLGRRVRGAVTHGMGC